MSAIWDSVIQWIDSIPPLIWSGAIGATVALIGVFFADRSNTKRLKLQLQHDATQRDRDRLAALRKDVYLQAPREAIKALTYLAKLATRDLATVGDDEGIAGYAAAAAQIGVISELPTVEAVGALGNALTLELIAAFRELQDVQDTRVDIQLSEQRLKVVTDEISRIQTELQAMSESGVQDPQRRGGLNYWLDVRMKEADALRTQLDALRPKHQQLLFEYNQGFFGRMPAITAKNISVMREIRKEIGLVHELDEYEEKMNRLAADLRAETLSLMEGWAKGMAEQEP